jgi:hypothetical protein
MQSAIHFSGFSWKVFLAAEGRRNSIEAAKCFFYGDKIPEDEHNVKMLRENGPPPVGHSIGTRHSALSARGARQRLAQPIEED